MSKGKRTINGTFGSVVLDGKKVAGVISFEAIYEFEKEDINMAGEFSTDTKYVGGAGKGTVKMYLLDSEFSSRVASIATTGKEVSSNMISTLEDPDAYGAERVAIKNCKFDSVALANWEVKKPTEVEMPFTFTGFEFIDKIKAN